MSDDERLYGLPGAEVLYREPAEVWESELDSRYEEDDPPEGWEVEEWTVVPAREHLPRADVLIEHILERWVGDETTEDAYEHWSDRASEEEAEVFLSAWASRIGYRMAAQHVGSHRMTLVGDEPHWDGEPLYRKASDADSPAV